MDKEIDQGRRALYTALRLHWLEDPTLLVEDWQVEDYREIPFSILFERLRSRIQLASIPHFDRTHFIALAEPYESPEELYHALSTDLHLDPKEQDKLYLILFELWRRLITDKHSLSIFCEELDHQIHLYDDGEFHHSERLQDVLAELQVVLEENGDEGEDPHRIFTYINENCAQDLESFLIDFIADQIDGNNVGYATELLDGFGKYLSPSPWLELLQIRLMAHSNWSSAIYQLSHLLDSTRAKVDLDFYIEVLLFLAPEDHESLFKKGVHLALPWVKTEEDWQDLLHACLEHYRQTDSPSLFAALQELVARHAHCPPQKQLCTGDEEKKVLKRLLT